MRGRPGAAGSGGICTLRGIDRTIRLLDLAGGSELSRVRYYEIHMLSPDRTRLVTGNGRSLQLLDLVTGTELARIQLEDRARAVEFDPEDARLVTRAGSTAAVWVT